MNVCLRNGNTSFIQAQLFGGFGMAEGKRLGSACVAINRPLFWLKVILIICYLFFSSEPNARICSIEWRQKLSRWYPGNHCCCFLIEDIPFRPKHMLHLGTFHSIRLAARMINTCRKNGATSTIIFDYIRALLILIRWGRTASNEKWHTTNQINLLGALHTTCYTVHCTSPWRYGRSTKWIT